MIEDIERLRCPPSLGKRYMVPCVCGSLFNIGPHSVPSEFWPVLRPSHQDSEYLPRFRTMWKETNGEWVEEDEVYYERDDHTPKHYHVDPRFTPESLYTPYERENSDWHTIITATSPVEFREMECLREMPIQRLFTGFGQKFVDDHRGKRLKCMRCPHKGIDLSSMPVVDGVVTCPAHGLRYDSSTGRCVTGDGDTTL